MLDINKWSQKHGGSYAIDLQRRGTCLFAPLVDVWDVQEEYFYSPVRFLYILENLKQKHKLQS
jgi:hypothetical protein